MYREQTSIFETFNLRGVAATLALASGLALTGCGGGGITGSEIGGRVLDGYISGAKVCLDSNNNLRCDADEPMATTVAGGKFTMFVPDGTVMGQAKLLVEVPVGAIDEDDPTNPIAVAFKLRGLANTDSLISPLTTAVQAYIDAGKTVAEANSAVLGDLGLSGDLNLNADYVAAQQVGIHNVAKVLAAVLQDSPSQTPTQLKTALVSLAPYAASAYAQNTAIDTTEATRLAGVWKTSATQSIAFASGFTAVDAASVGYAYQGLTTEGGAFNWAVADGGSYGWGGSDFWWSGIASNDTPPSFYWGGAGKADQAYMESWVNAPSNGTVSLSGQSLLRLTVWGNNELVGAPRFTPVIQLAADSNNCYARAEAPPLTPAASGAATYDVQLSDFVVKENCGTAMTTAQFMLQPIGSVRVRIYKENYYTNNGAYGQPNGMNVGPISFVK
jgi:hypothetical protein